MVDAMNIGSKSRENQGDKSAKPMTNPWMIILVTAPIPLLLFILFFVKWYQQKSDLARISSQFIQRQNSVLAHSALEVSTGFSDLLEKADRDVRIFSLLGPTSASLNKFYHAQAGDFTRYDTKNTAVIQEPLPFYNRLAVLNLKGDTVIQVLDGKVDEKVRPLTECRLSELCDRDLFEKAVRMKVGDTRYGRLLRFYTPEGTEENPKGASLAVAYRAQDAIYVVGIDYLQLRDHLTTPTFPYDPKRDLEQAYQKGNYIYILDDANNVITHPLPWVQAGIDKATGTWRTPMKTDEDGGKHPINVNAYERGKLKEYFDRLQKISFATKSVDLFQAPNLAGTSRVLSVIPVAVSKGQYKESGIFGHAIIGCHVEYFEEPKEKVVPYY